MLNIRRITATDKDEYINMAREFYSTDAVLFCVPEGHFFATFDELMRSDCYAVCYIFELDGKIAGYSLLANTFSQEAGGKVVWIEEIFVLPEFRGMGIAKNFFTQLINSRTPDIKRFRLEAERANEGAIRLYKSLGFDFLDYDQMVLDF